jgi:ribosomal protein L2
LLKYSDGEQSYILAPDGLEVGARVTAGEDVPPKVGNALPLRVIPLGANIHCIEIMPGRGGQIARSAGQQATLSNREGGYALVKLPSGEIRRIHDSAYVANLTPRAWSNRSTASASATQPSWKRSESDKPFPRNCRATRTIVPTLASTRCRPLGFPALFPAAELRRNHPTITPAQRCDQAMN